MGGNNSLHKPLFGDFNLSSNIASNNTTYNNTNCNNTNCNNINCSIIVVFQDSKGMERQSESDKESRSGTIEEDKNNWPIQGKEGLALQPTKFYVEEIGISP